MENKGVLRQIIFGARPKRAEQSQPARHAVKNVWGDTKTYIRQEDALRQYVKGRNYIIGPDGRITRVDDEKIKEAIGAVFGGRDRLTREEANRNIRLGHKDAKSERARGILPSMAEELRKKEKVMDILKPGPRVVKPGMGRAIWNTVRMVAGKEPIIDKPEPLDSSVINQNTPKIK